MIRRAPRFSFHVITLYYRLMVAFNKRRLMFLSTRVSNKILSMFCWLTYCKCLQKNPKHTGVQIFKDLKLIMDKHVLNSDFCVINMNNVDVILGYMIENTTKFNPQSQSFQHSIAVNIRDACLASDQEKQVLKFFLFLQN
jgi:hypothetical protein